jgi:oligopeptide/dipeptide ABC transporter ATP-binding protein
MTPLLSVRHLRTTFRTRHGLVHAVDDVSFDLEAGETLGLVGESGCGKTVTALSLLRLLETPPAFIDPGSAVEYEGKNLLALSDEELRRIRGAQIAIIFQEPGTSLNPVLSVGLQIAETLRAHRPVSWRDARARAVELLAMVGVPDPADAVRAYPHQLSGGLQQRVMIAIALSCEPRILIADEPTTALDVTIQAQILRLLADLKRRLGMAMILITHDLGVVAGLANRVVVMYAGQVVEATDTATLFRAPAHPYTQALLAAVPRLDRPVVRLPAIPGAVPPATAWPSGCRFHPRCPHAWDRCRTSAPELLAVPGDRLSEGPAGAVAGVARCWLHDPAAGTASS